MVADIRDIITGLKFGDDRFRGLASAGGQMSRLEQKWFISVRGESEKNAIEVSRYCGLRAQPGSRYLQ